jgi:hypothetical protein
MLLLVTAGRRVYYAGAEPYHISRRNCKFGLLINQHGRTFVGGGDAPQSNCIARHGTLSKHPISIISLCPALCYFVNKFVQPDER